MSSERTSYNQRGHFFGHKDGTAKFLLLWLAAYKERTKRANKIVVTFIRHMLTELVIHYKLSVRTKMSFGMSGLPGNNARRKCRDLNFNQLQFLPWMLVAFRLSLSYRASEVSKNTKTLC